MKMRVAAGHFSEANSAGGVPVSIPSDKKVTGDDIGKAFFYLTKCGNGKPRGKRNG